MALETDAAQHDHLVIAFGFLEGLVQDLLRILAVAGKKLLVGARHARRSLDQTVAVGIVAPVHSIMVRNAVFDLGPARAVRFRSSAAEAAPGHVYLKPSRHSSVFAPRKRGHGGDVCLMLRGGKRFRKVRARRSANDPKLDIHPLSFGHYNPTLLDRTDETVDK